MTTTTMAMIMMTIFTYRGLNKTYKCSLKHVSATTKHKYLRFIKYLLEKHHQMFDTATDNRKYVCKPLLRFALKIVPLTNALSKKKCVLFKQVYSGA